MKTLAITNGDLTIGPGGAQLVEGQAKVRQDLGIALREPLGCDRFHPEWGAILGRFIGVAHRIELMALVKAEVTRVTGGYMTRQTQMVQDDAIAGRRTRFRTGEVIATLSGVEVRPEYDRYLVRVSPETMPREQAALQATVRD